MKPALLFLALVLVAAVVFTLWPGIDLWFSGLFYREAGGFFLADVWWARWLYELIPVLAVAIGVGCLFLILLNAVRRRALGPLTNRALLFLLVVLATGPGLVVNGLFKEHWGRARPRAVAEFGGNRSFTPALVPTDQCEHNCSFVAGHPSVPFCLVALGFLVAARRRRLAFAAAIGLGALAGLGRIVQGAHFLSDVVFSGIVVFALTWLLARAVFRLPEAASGS